MKNKVFTGRKEALDKTLGLINKLEHGSITDAKVIQNELNDLRVKDPYYRKGGSRGQFNRGAELRDLADEIDKLTDNDVLGKNEGLSFGLKVAAEAVKPQGNQNRYNESIIKFGTWISQNKNAFKELYRRVFSTDKNTGRIYPSVNLGNGRTAPEAKDINRDIKVPEEMFDFLQDAIQRYKTDVKTILGSQVS